MYTANAKHFTFAYWNGKAQPANVKKMAGKQGHVVTVAVHLSRPRKLGAKSLYWQHRGSHWKQSTINSLFPLSPIIIYLERGEVAPSSEGSTWFLKIIEIVRYEGQSDGVHWLTSLNAWLVKRFLSPRIHRFFVCRLGDKLVQREEKSG